MKKILLSTSLFFLCASLSAQSIFLTEYVEGNKNQHALEIMNNSGAAINIADLRIRTYYNGSSNPAKPVIASFADDGTTATISNKGVFVFYFTGADGFDSAEADKIFPNATKSQRIGTADGGALGFNGNDAIKLQYNSQGEWKTVDLFGKVGDVPDKNAWSSGDATAKDRTLYRLPSVKTGITVSPETFDISKEWGVLTSATPVAPFPSLGKIGNLTK